MATNNAVIDIATGAVKRFGGCDFTTDGSFDPVTEQQISLFSNARPIKGVPIRHQKIVNGRYREMTPPEKSASDASASAVLQIQFHASSKLLNSEVEITEPGPATWQVIGGVVAKPGFFTQSSHAFGRVVLAYRTVGAGMRFRLSEDDGAGKVTNLSTSPNLPDTGDAWKQDVSINTTAPLSLNTRNRYFLEAQLNGSTSGFIGYVSLSLLERVLRDSPDKPVP